MVATHVAPARGFGGVAESGAALVREWARLGLKVALVASDASKDAPITAADAGLPPPSETTLYRSRMARRWGFGLGAIPKIWRAVRSSRLVYVNGIATWPVTLGALFAILSGKRTTIALRGGLMAPHVAIIRTRKKLKWMFYRLVTLPLLRRAAILHATSELEARDARALLPNANIVIAANGIALERFHAAVPFAPRKLTFLYLGRISPEKGVLSFARIFAAAAEPGETLVVAGAGDDDYALRLSELAQLHPEKIELRGLVAREDVPVLFAQADFLVLPSGLEDGDIRENFGNSAAEALASGVPVLVTRGLAWDALESAGAGFLFAPTPVSVRAAIATARAIAVRGIVPMRRAARGFAEAHLSIGRTAAILWAAVSGAAASETAPSQEGRHETALGAP